MISLTYKTKAGSRHTYFIDENTKIVSKKQVKNKKGEYIQHRTNTLDGHTVDFALRLFDYVDSEGNIHHYKKTDLAYDLRIGRIEFQ